MDTMDEGGAKFSMHYVIRSRDDVSSAFVISLDDSNLVPKICPIFYYAFRPCCKMENGEKVKSCNRTLADIEEIRIGKEVELNVSMDP